MFKSLRRYVWITGLSLPLTSAGLALAAKPTAEEALALKPLQADVDYERPEKADVAKCVVDADNTGGGSGYVVRHGTGRLLRKFIDTNGDGRLDQWCYYRDGVEIYRDIDSDFNKRADQYRWLATEGIRWALDKDEDGLIDVWKAISPEEVTAEVVAALRDKDAVRFQRLLLTKDELAALGLPEAKHAEVEKSLAAAKAGFAELAKKQNTVSAKSHWLNFGANRPGVIPAGQDGLKQDLMAYESVSAIVETDGKHSQVLVGTLVRVKDTWKLVDLPKNLLDEQVVAGPLFFAPVVRVPDADTAVAGVPMPNAEIQKLLGDLSKLEEELAKATKPADMNRVSVKRFDILDKIIESSGTLEERKPWVQNLAESLSAAVQGSNYTAGVERLEQLYEKVNGWDQKGELAGLVRFRWLDAQHFLSLQDPKVDFEKVNDRWLADLEEFVTKYPRATESAEAMLQLAQSQEALGKDEEAIEWYTRLAKEFSGTGLSEKATGAKRRLTSVGKPLALKGKTLEGKTFDISTVRGRIVAVQYWATWSDRCKEDMDTLKQLYAKYGRKGFQPIGVILDNDSKAAAAFIRGKSVAWPQLHEPGGLDDSRLAKELGIPNLPYMILVDEKGNVIDRDAHVAELDKELGKRLK